MNTGAWIKMQQKIAKNKPKRRFLVKQQEVSRPREKSSRQKSSARSDPLYREKKSLGSNRSPQQILSTERKNVSTERHIRPSRGRRKNVSTERKSLSVAIILQRYFSRPRGLCDKNGLDKTKNQKVLKIGLKNEGFGRQETSKTIKTHVFSSKTLAS